jgi:hypothetical protein
LGEGGAGAFVADGGVVFIKFFFSTVFFVFCEN